jgi:small-conductance mechanosensitive channel
MHLIGTRDPKEASISLIDDLINEPGAIGVALWLSALLGLTLVTLWIKRRVINRYFTRISRGDQARVLALRQITQSMTRWGIWLIFATAALDTVGIDVSAFIAALGIAGLAISFGAQSFIKDVISYVVQVFADNFRIGEEVTMDGKRGLIQKFEMSSVVLLSTPEDQEPRLVYVPYSKIATVENFTRPPQDA